MLSKTHPYFTLIVLAASPLVSAAAAEEKPAPAAQQVEPATGQAPNETWESENRQAALRVQLFLDREGFGPGKIDGRWGGFSQKAAERWNASESSSKIAILEGGLLDVAKANEISYSDELLTSYQVTDKDQALIGDVPDKPEEMAKLKELPYTSLLELVAEKFHSDPDYLREINGLGPDGGLSVGSKVKVPNVEKPFDIAEPMALSKAAEDAKGQDKKADKDKAAETSDDKAKVEPKMELTVIRNQQVVELRDGGKLIRSFPISPGASDNQSPAGNWRVSSVSWMPEFRWDKSMLEDGKRSKDAHLLPPGPNNPVGIVWIALNADGIGLHGTPFPDDIGRNRSHGCIRLSNWDALDLGKIITPGTRVVVN